MRRPWIPALVLGAAATAAPSQAAPEAYVVDAAASRVRVHVGRAGLFSFAGHEHEVAATAVEGRILADAVDLSASRVELTFATAALTVLPEGEPAGDPPKVEAAMRGDKVLEVARFPTVTFVSRSVSGTALPGGAYDLRVAGDLTIRGLTRSFTLPVRAAVEGDVLTAEGRLTLRHDQFGMQPVSVAGVVKVKNEIVVSYKFVARAEPSK